jgi:hypothetical protein
MKKRARRKNKRRDLNGYRSGFELDTSKVLKHEERKLGYSWSYESDYIEYFKPVTHHKYTPDFTINMRDGRVWYLETKGRWDANDRKKHKLLKEQRPDLDVRMFFMRDNPIRKGSKTKYSDWCRKLQIPFCIGELNMEWFNND